MERPRRSLEPPLRQSHDLRRAVITSADAAKRLRQSRYWVAQRVQSGALEGYGIPANERTRWFVYEDAVREIEDQGRPPTPPQSVPAVPDVQTLLAQTASQLRTILKSIQLEREHVGEGYSTATHALDEWSAVHEDPQIAIKQQELLQSRDLCDKSRRAIDTAMHDLEDKLRLAVQLVS